MFLKFKSKLIHMHTAMVLPEDGFYWTLWGHLGCDGMSLPSKEEDVALLILSLAHKSGGAGAY